MENEDFRYDESLFKPVAWNDVEEDREVWLRGTHLGRFRAYGPHWVENKEKKSLRNRANREFLHWAEDLLVLKEKNIESQAEKEENNEETPTENYWYSWD